MPASKPPIQWTSALVVTLKRGLAGKRWDVKATAAALGLRKREAVVVKPNNSSVLGMLAKVKRLVQAETLEMYQARVQAEAEKKAWKPPLVVRHSPPEPKA